MDLPSEPPKGTVPDLRPVALLHGLADDSVLSHQKLSPLELLSLNLQKRLSTKIFF